MKLHFESFKLFQTTNHHCGFSVIGLTGGLMRSMKFLAKLEIQKQVISGKLQILAFRNLKSSGTPTFLSKYSIME